MLSRFHLTTIRFDESLVGTKSATSTLLPVDSVHQIKFTRSNVDRESGRSKVTGPNCRPCAPFPAGSGPPEARARVVTDPWSASVPQTIVGAVVGERAQWSS
ncbi:hypothetical protein CBS147333_10210 [Penicillium roqueforti]|nr:hypothetical protein CBS147333_10210 [Penicillium roqueforti]KAI3188532.1 hypothetical protein CBS147311_10051 [Penicillium roqueforti]KAI3260794.1 hypothetical protein CBS147308_10187 [Penicillium roqueforti]KAI3276427.1 hypothetical protein DTO003C3_10192 [Penicillium roqueforti]